MNNMIKTTILNSIDNIDEIVFESELNIYDSLLAEYDKAINIMEMDFSSPLLDTFFQEADTNTKETNTDTNTKTDNREKSGTNESLMDVATGKYKDESIAWKVFAFIPRLFIEMGKRLIDSIKGLFKGKSENEINADVKDMSEKAKETLESASDNEIEKINEELDKIAKSDNNNGDDGDKSITYDPDKKVFHLGGFGRLLNGIALLISAKTILPNMAKKIKSGNNNYAELIKNLKKIKTDPNTSKADTMVYTINSLYELLGDSSNAAMIVNFASKEIAEDLRLQIKREMKKGKDPKKLKELQELSQEVQRISRHIMFAGGGIRVLSGINVAILNTIKNTKNMVINGIKGNPDDNGE